MRIRSIVPCEAVRIGLVPLVLFVLSVLFAGSLGDATAARAQESAPGGADREWRFIEKLEQDGMTDLAVRQLEQFATNFRDDPRASGALLRAAAGYRALGQASVASGLYERLLRDFASSEEAPAAGLARADLFTEAEQWDRAVVAYRSLLESYPAAPQAETAVLGLAEALMAQREDVEARRLLGRLAGGRASDEVGSRALFDLALLDLRAGADSLAIERFEAIHQRYPERPIGAFGLLRAASLLQEREAPAAARAHYERVLELFDEPILRSRAHLGLAASMESEDPKRAAKHLRAVAEEGGASEDVQQALLGLGRVSLAAKDPRGASQAASDFLSRYPDSPEVPRAHLIQAHADLAQGKQTAIADLLALGEAPDAEVAHEALATAAGAQEAAGDVEAAMQTWRRAERAAPDAQRRAEALLAQAASASRTGRPALAAELALAAHDAAADDGMRARALQVALAARVAAGQHEAAMLTAQRIAKEHPSSEQATHARGEMLRLERLSALDPAGAARALGDLALRPDENPAQRSLEVARIYRDRLGDHAAALATLKSALDASDKPAARARIELELARTYQLHAAARGYAGDREAAGEALRLARAALASATSRTREQDGIDDVELMSIGLDLATATRADAPWTFDPLRTPLLSTPAGSGTRLPKELDDARRRLDTALDRPSGPDQRAWIVWRWAELSDSPADRKMEVVREAIASRPDPSLESGLRLVLGQLLLASEASAEAARELAGVLEREGGSELGLAARYALADAHRLQKRFAQAGDLYAEYATAVPHTAHGQRALLLAGDSALYAGRGEIAVERYRLLIERYPGSTYEDDALYRLGTALERAGRLEAAREPLMRLAQWKGESEYRGRALARLAAIEQAAGRPAQARAALEQLVNVDVERAVEERAWNGLARASLAEGEPARALEWLDRGAKRTEPDAEAFALRIEAASKKGDLDRAADTLQKFSRAYADQADAVARGRLHLAQAQRGAGRSDAALESAELALSEAVEPAVKAQAYHEIALVHAQAKRWEDARAAWSAAEKAAPTSEWAAQALFRLGQYHGSLNEDAASQKAFAAVVARFPRSPHAVEAMRGEARAWRQMGRYDLALELYHRLLEEYPEAPGGEEVLSNIAYCHHEMGQFEVAIAAYRRVMPFLDEEGQAYAVFWIADGLDRLGRHQEAATEFLRIPYLYPDQGMLPVTAQLKAGEAYERVPDPDAARSLYERVLRTHGPSSDWGREAQQRIERLPAAPSREDERGSR